MGNQSSLSSGKIGFIGRNYNSIDRRAARQYQTFEKLKEDIKKANSYATFIKVNTLQFKLLAKNDIAVELLHLAWRFGDNVKVQVVVNGGVYRPLKSNRYSVGNNNNMDINKKEMAVSSNHTDKKSIPPVNKLGTTNSSDSNNNMSTLPKPAKSCDVLIPISTFYKIFVILLEVVDIPFGLDKKRSNGENEEVLTNVEDDDYDKECIICMENNIEIVLQCSHAFCKKCYTDWKKRNNECPYCRSTVMPDVDSEDIWTIDETDCLEELNKRLIDLEVILMGLLLG